MKTLQAPDKSYRVYGERLYLRPITEEDTEMVLRWRNADRTRNNFYYRKLITPEEHLKWVREKVAKGIVHQFIAVLKEEDLPIGCVYLQHFDPGDQSMESGVFFDEKAPVGKGYASEAVALLNREYAFRVLGIHRTFARVLGYNTASRRVHEKAGFSLQAVLEHDAEFNGKWEDTYVYEYLNPEYEVRPVFVPAGKTQEPLRVSVPGSKSITNRALLLATLAEGTSVLRGVLFSDDSRHFLKCVEDLGFAVTIDKEKREVTVEGKGGTIPQKEASLNVGSAGTAARFLTAVLGVSEGVYHMDSSEQMKRRPMAPLLKALEELGCRVTYGEREGFFPFTLEGRGFGKHTITIDIGQSSQFLSALLIASVLDREGMEIRIRGTHGMAYIEMTRKMMEEFGARHGQPDQRYRALDYAIEPDASAAAYFYAMCPLLGIPVRVEGVHFDGLQGDTEFIRILERTGCKATDQPEGILLEPSEDGIIRGITVDMSACSDQAITLAALAPFADGPTTITGIGHIRLQESDRLAAIATELGRMGIRTEEREDSITIYPGLPKSARVETYQDHRMAMGFSLIGLRVPGITILNPACCRKTFENYFLLLDEVIEDLKKL